MNIDCFCITNLCWLNQVKLSLLILYINMFKNVCWWNHHYPAIFVGKQAFSTEKNHFAHGTYVLTKEQLKTRNRPGEASVEGLLEATKTWRYDTLEKRINYGGS